MNEKHIKQFDHVDTADESSSDRLYEYAYHRASGSKPVADGVRIHMPLSLLPPNYRGFDCFHFSFRFPAFIVVFF